MSSAKGLADWYSPYEVGTGRLDVAAAVRDHGRGHRFAVLRQLRLAARADATSPVTKDLTFTNHGTADVTLDLALTGDGPFTLGASTVTVPAGGTATVPVTGDPPAAGYGPAHRLRGRHRRGHRHSRSPARRSACIKEDERYDLNDQAGRPRRQARHRLGRASARPATSGRGRCDVEGEHDAAAAAGHLHRGVRTSTCAGEQAGPLGLAVLVDPETVLDRPAEVVLDARKARLLRDRRAAAHRGPPAQGRLQIVVRRRRPSSASALRRSRSTYDDLYVSPTEPMTEGAFMLTTRWRKGEPMLSLSALGGCCPSTRRCSRAAR